MTNKAGLQKPDVVKSSGKRDIKSLKGQKLLIKLNYTTTRADSLGLSAIQFGNISWLSCVDS